jgi:hypothetical protein
VIKAIKLTMIILVGIMLSGCIKSDNAKDELSRVCCTETGGVLEDGECLPPTNDYQGLFSINDYNSCMQSAGY